MINIDEIGTLDKRVQLLKYEDVKNAGSSITHKMLVPAFSNRIWARIEPTRGLLYYEQYKNKTEDLIKITIRYRKDINDSMFIKYKDVLYAIKTIIDPYEAHVKLELMCNIKNRGKRESFEL